MDRHLTEDAECWEPATWGVAEFCPTARDTHPMGYLWGSGQARDRWRPPEKTCMHDSRGYTVAW